MYNDSSKDQPVKKASSLAVNWGSASTVWVSLVAVSCAFIASILAFTFLEADLFFLDDITKNLIGLSVDRIVLLLVIMTFVSLRSSSVRSLGLFKTEKQNYLIAFGWFFVYLAISSVVLYGLTELSPQLDLNQEQIQPFKDAAGLVQLIVSFIALVIIAPITEEIVFRGFIFKGMQRSMGTLVAAINSSLLFAFVHGQLNVGIDTFILGMVAALLTAQFKSIYPAIMLHAVKNGLAFTLLYFTDLA